VEESVAEPSGFMTDLSQSAYLSLSIKRAISAAQQRSHRYVTLEHLVLAMLDDPGAMEILEGLRADIPSIRREITETVNRNLATLYAPGEGDQRASYKVERVLGTASDDASRLGCDEVDAAFVIAAMSRETDSPAAEVLKRNGVTYTNAVTWLYTNRGASFGGRTQRARPQPAPTAPAPVAPAPAPPPAAPTPPAPSAAPPPKSAPSATPAAAAPQPAPRSMADALAKVREEAETSAASGEAEDFDDDEVDDLDLEEDSDHAPSGGETGAVAMGRTPREAQRTPAPVQPAPRPQAVPAGPRRTERIETRPIPAPPAPAPVNPAPRHADPEPVNRNMPGPGQRRGEAQVPPSSRLDEMRVRTSGPQAKPRPVPPPQPHPAASPPPAPPAPLTPGAAARTRSRGNEAPAAEIPARETAAPASETAPTPRPGRRKPRAQHPLVGRLIENIPRRMRAGVADRIEVRISREDTQKLMRGMEGRGEPVRHDIALTQTMSVALRAPDGGFTIEPMSPETQWIFERPDNAETYGRWRWVVTPHSSGERRLQLLVASRSIGPNGLVGDSALPDQIITVRVRINYWRALGRGLQWLAALVVGGVLTEAVLMGLKLFGKQ
jgi:hypothetical protein